jgi:hypothetical protein
MNSKKEAEYIAEIVRLKAVKRKKIDWIMLGIIFAPILIVFFAIWLIGSPS